MSHIGIFLDRDGTINYEVDFLRSPHDLRLIPDSAKALRQANEIGCKVFVITNQSGISRGILTEKILTEIHDALQAKLRAEGAAIDAFYYCPHHPDVGVSPYRTNCKCRKPDIGMLIQARDKFNIDLSKSFVIGDKMIDIQTGNNAGAKSILVLTGYGNSELKNCTQNNLKLDFVAKNLYDAIQFVKSSIYNEQPITC